MTATDLPLAKPSDVGLSAERLGRLDGYMRRYVDGGTLAGMQLLVARHGKVAYFKSYGAADMAAALPLTSDTIYRIQSMAKPITATAVMILYERGAFLLSDPVSKYVPQLADLQVYVEGEGDETVSRPAKRAITIQDLLRHTSGLGYDFMGPPWQTGLYRKFGAHTSVVQEQQYTDMAPQTLAALVENAARVPLAFEPGTRWQYSISLDVLAHLIEVVTGQTMDAFLRENLFGPLGMDDSGYYVPAGKLERFSALYAAGPDGALVEAESRLDGPSTRPPLFFRGGSGMVSTARDYFRFAQMLLQGGTLDGVRILSPKTVALMTRDHLPKSARGDVLFPGTGHGLGVAVVRDPAVRASPASAGSYFWAGMANTNFWNDPSEDLVVIQMSQFVPSMVYPIQPELEALVYQAIIGD